MICHHTSYSFVYIFCPCRVFAKSSLAILKPILESPDHPKEDRISSTIGHMSLCSNEGIHLQGIVFDTMIASYLIDPNNRQHGIDAIAQQYLGIEKISSTESPSAKGPSKFP
ncbi:MAG: hypothetical protein R3A45_09625 [Bdellovibrionota bacterium]